MTHVRRRIRDAVVDEMHIFQEAGYLVSARRYSSLGEDEIPAILVKTADPGEQSEPVTMGMGHVVLERTSALTISGIVAEDEPDLDDKLEEIAETIERSITQTHGGLAKSTMLTATTKEVDTLGETPVAAISLEFAVVYHTASNDPSTPL